MDFFSMGNLIKGGKIFLILILVGFLAAIAYGIGTFIGAFIPVLKWAIMIAAFLFELLLLGWAFTKWKKWIK